MTDSLADIAVFPGDTAAFCDSPGCEWALRSAQLSAATHVISVLALLSLLVFAWIVYTYSKDLYSIFLYVFNVRSWGKPLRLSAVDGYTESRRKLSFFLLAWGGLLWFCYALEVDTALCRSIPFTNGTGTPVFVYLSFGFALLLILVYGWLKHGLLTLTANVLEEEKFSAFTVRTGLYHDLVFSFVCLPLLACSRTLNPGGRTLLVQILFVLFCILLVYKLFHLIFEGIRLTKFSHLHIFVYLCALEIALPLVLWRLLFLLVTKGLN